MAEIPCHAVKSPFEAARQPGDPQLWASTASCDTSGLAERDLAGSAAKSEGLQREDNIFYWKPSKRQQEKKGSVHTPDTRPAHWAACPLSTGRVAKATGSPEHLPKKAAKFLTDGTGTDTGGRQPLKWKFANVSGCPGNQEPIWSWTCCVTTLLQASVSLSVNREAPFLYAFLLFDDLFKFQITFSKGNHNLQTIFKYSHPTSKKSLRQEKAEPYFHIADKRRLRETK